jgi:hypothetical protein
MIYILLGVSGIYFFRVIGFGWIIIVNFTWPYLVFEYFMKYIDLNSEFR